MQLAPRIASTHVICSLNPLLRTWLTTESVLWGAISNQKMWKSRGLVHFFHTSAKMPCRLLQISQFQFTKKYNIYIALEIKLVHTGTHTVRYENFPKRRQWIWIWRNRRGGDSRAAPQVRASSRSPGQGESTASMSSGRGEGNLVQVPLQDPCLGFPCERTSSKGSQP